MTRGLAMGDAVNASPVVAVVALLVAAGCDRRAAEGARQPDSSAAPVAGVAASRGGPASSPASGEPARIRPMKKVPILVGGCGGECSEPAMAVAAFLQATADPEDPDRIARFVDATTLVVDGRPLGEEWARMWREMRAATRKDSIREAARDLAAWADGLTGDQVRAVLAAGARPVRVWTTEAVYDLAIPGGSWRLTLRPRGIEWLVARVERRPGVTADPGHDGR